MKCSSQRSGTMQKRSFSHKRVDYFHSFSASKSKSVPLNKNEWGDNFIMDRCGLPCVPSLKGRESVQFVSLQHNLICRIDSLVSFRMLKVLNLYDNKIERISGLDTLTSLRVLMLGKNRLKSTDGLEALESLDILDLHGNQIAALTGVSRLRALRVLNLAANSLKKLPSLDGLIALEELNAKRNRIAKIVPEVAHARRLERLYLSNNEMRRLDDLSPLQLLNGLKELSLDGNPLTFNANYVVYTVSLIPSLVLLDQNVISSGLRNEADHWSSNRLPGSVGSLMDAAKVKPIVTVHHKMAIGSSGGANGTGTTLKTTSSSSSSSSASNRIHHHQRNVAVVRPMSAQLQQPELPTSSHYPPHAAADPADGLTVAQVATAGGLDPPLRLSAPASSPSVMKSCLVRSDHGRRKSFRQIAFSAMVCNTRPADDRELDRPVFRFSLRPPTAELRDNRERQAKRSNSSHCARRRHRSRAALTHDFDDSSDSWNSDSDDSDTGSMASVQSRKAVRSSPTTRVSTAPSVGTCSSRAAANSKSPAGVSGHHQKLSATIGMNIKEQLRDLRIIVGEEEVHISGLNIVRMIHNIHWSSDEVELLHTIVFYGLTFDQIAPFYSSLRTLFPNVRNFAFRKMPASPSLRHINGLAQLENPTWFRWTLGVETLSPAVELPAKANWKSYAIYRLHPFGLEQIDGRQIESDDVASAEDEYATLDSLVMLTAPSSTIRRQLQEHFSLLDVSQSSSSSSTTSSSSLAMDSGGTVGGQQQQSSRDTEYSLLMRKRAIRAVFQPLKEAKHLRSRSSNLQYIAEYGMEVAIKLSFLSQNWDRLLADMVQTASSQVEDEAVYKRTKMAHIRANKTHAA